MGLNFKNRPTKWKLFFYGFWGFIVAGIGLLVVIFYFISMGWLGYMPPIEELQNPHNHFATEIFSADGMDMGRYYRGAGNRVSIQYRDISPNVIEALIATEDVRYLEHSGIDFKGLARAIFLLGRNGGGSTITQQLAKQLYSSGGAKGKLERALQKPVEWVIAVKLEHYYTKEDILTMYLNQFDFLYNAIGIKSAAEVYFNTSSRKLTLPQAATLIGMCKNPSIYNPVRNPEKALARRNTVLNQMMKANLITPEEEAAAAATELGIHFTRPSAAIENMAPYFREHIRRVMTAPYPERKNYADWQNQQYHDDSLAWADDPLYGWCAKNKKPDGSNYDLYSDGLRIYTTLDSRMQTYAEESMREHLQTLQRYFYAEKRGTPNGPFDANLTREEVQKIMDRSMKQTGRYCTMKNAGASEEEIKKAFNTPQEMTVFSYKGLRDTTMTPLDSIMYYKYFLRSGFMAMDPFTGYVKAYVGGVDYDHFQYDMVSLGRRQIGSTAKPYLYSLAMEEGMWPCDKVQCLTHYGNWRIHGGGAGMMSLEAGLAGSVNTCAAGLLAYFSPQALVKMMRNFGLQGELDPNPTLCLGTCDVSVNEMVSGYTCFPNKGIRVSPIFVTRIEDADGNVVSTFRPRTFEVMSELASYKMIHIMKGVVNRGTGRRIRGMGVHMDLAGKTGTTQRNSDGWFMCYSPELVCGTWVGGEDRSIHFASTGIGQGASMALPISAGFLRRVYNNSRLGYHADRKFDIPEDFDPNEGCKENYIQIIE